MIMAECLLREEGDKGGQRKLERGEGKIGLGPRGPFVDGQSEDALEV